jgi:hypothetical protein
MSRNWYTGEMAEEMQAKEKKGKATQDIVLLKEIRDGIAILNDGTMRGTVMVSSVNLALKSQDEQDATVYAYQDFLNSLDFPIQISVTSRKMDITPYLEQLRQLKEQQQNELLRLQTKEYINFVDALVTEKDNPIMTKTFFVTVPFAVAESRKESATGRIFKSVKGAAGKHTMSDKEFEHNKSQLLQRLNQVAIGLRGFGLRLAPLNTQELLELYYMMYNPKTSRNQKLNQVGNLEVKEI